MCEDEYVTTNNDKSLIPSNEFDYMNHTIKDSTKFYIDFDCLT